MKKTELVAPGGSLEKIEYAYHYGADAVYLGLPDFSLRARINEFSEKKIAHAVELARGLGKKIYFTLNIYAHERHLPKLEKHLKFIAKTEPDALIISDPGIINLAKKLAPKIKIHLSTQANTTNSEAVKFWQSQGVSRIILAREITLEEIKAIRKKCQKIELEYFVHGAMCMSVSGRCLLSRFLCGRGANLGDCVQPCRWPYKVKSEKLKVKSFGVSLRETNYLYNDTKQIILEEDEQGTYLFNSKDLCLIEYLDELKKAGISAFKIEGRTKSVCYVATAAKAYRRVLDALTSGKGKSEIKKSIKEARKELEKLTNRGYTTGFLLGKDKWENNFECSHRKNNWQFVGQVLAAKGDNWARAKIHNALRVGESIEVFTPVAVFTDKIKEMRNINGEKANSAHGGSKNIYLVKFSRIYPPKSLLRKRWEKRGSGKSLVCNSTSLYNVGRIKK